MTFSLTTTQLGYSRNLMARQCTNNDDRKECTRRRNQLPIWCKLVYRFLFKLILVFRSNAELSYIRIHIVNRIVVAEGIWRYAVVLLRERILGEPAAEDRVVLTGTVVDVADGISEGGRIERRLLLLAVVAEPVGVILEACIYIPSTSERIVVVGLDHFS